MFLHKGSCLSFPYLVICIAVNRAKNRIQHHVSVPMTEYKKCTQWDHSLPFALCLLTSKLIRVILWDIVHLHKVS